MPVLLTNRIIPRPDLTAPTAPTITASQASTSSISVALTNPATDTQSGVKDYRLEYKRSVDSTWTLDNDALTAASFPRTIGGLTAATSYDTRCRATDFAGNVGAFSATSSASTAAESLPLGSLALDGDALPEVLNLILPVTGALPQSATATCRYKRSVDSTWTTGHPPYRVRTDLADPPPVGSLTDCFAWPIIGLTPGVSYDVEWTVTSGASSSVKTLTTLTRALPAAAGTPNKTANSVATIVTQFSGLNPGDALEIAEGTYVVSGLTLNRSGTALAPI